MSILTKSTSFLLLSCFLLILAPFPQLFHPNIFESSLSSEAQPSSFPFHTKVINRVKSLGTIPWFWDQYASAPGPLAGDDVIRWGPSLGPYHNYSEVLDHIYDRLTDFPDLLRIFKIGVSYNGLSIPCVALTAPGDASNRQGFLIVAHHHGREAITVEHVLYLLDFLLANSTQPEVQRILNHFVFYLIPTLNPDVLGMLHINPWQRKNLHPTDEDGDGLADEWEVQDVNGDYIVDFYEEDESYYTYEGLDLDGDGDTGEDLPGGVDLNRNYPVAFTGGENDPRSVVYHGTAPFSEPETQAMLNFTLKHYQQLVFGVSLHSGVSVLLTPWSYTSEPSEFEPFFANLGAAVEEASGYDWWSATQLYPSFGTWDDWLFGGYGIPAVTLETYGNESAWGHSIWDYFNPSADQVLSICYRVRDAIFAMTATLMDEPGEAVIVVPGVVSSVISTHVSVYIDASASGFQTLLLEYRYNPEQNHNWVGLPLVYREGNRYEAFVPASALGGIVELHVYGYDFAGHVIYSDSIFYSISPFIFAGLVITIVLLIVVIGVAIWVIIRRRRHQRT